MPQNNESNSLITIKYIFEEIASLGELYLEIQAFIVNHFYTVHTYLISILSLSVGEKPGI